MKHKRVLLIFMAFQLSILISMVIWAMRPLLYGKEVRLKIQSRDPRSIFRGQYLDLNYEFSRINLDTLEHGLENGQEFYYGDELFLELRSEKEAWRAIALWNEPQPTTDNIFLSVRVKHHYKIDRNRTYNLLHLDAGLSAYYVSPAQAERFQELMRTPLDSPLPPLYVRVMIDDRGKARIKALDFEL